MTKFNVVTLTCLSIAFLTFVSINACRKSIEAPYDGSGGNPALQKMNGNNGKPLNANSAKTPPLLVAPDEYVLATPFEQKMIDQTQAAVNQLYAQFDDPETSGQAASFIFYADGQAGPIVLGPPPPVDPAAALSCTACGLKTAYKCYNAFKKYVEDNHLSSIKILAEIQSDGCVKITVISFVASGPGGFPPITRPDTLVLDTTDIIRPSFEPLDPNTPVDPNPGTPSFPRPTFPLVP